MLEKLFKGIVKEEDVAALTGAVGRLEKLLERQAAAQERCASALEEYVAVSAKAMGVLRDGLEKGGKK